MSVSFVLPPSVNPGVTLRSELEHGTELVVHKNKEKGRSYYAGEISWVGGNLEFYSDGSYPFSVEELESILEVIERIKNSRGQESNCYLTNEDN